MFEVCCPIPQLVQSCSESSQFLVDVDGDGRQATLFWPPGDSAAWLVRLGAARFSEYSSWQLQLPARDYAGICWMGQARLGLHWHVPGVHPLPKRSEAPGDAHNFEVVGLDPATSKLASFWVGNYLSHLQSDANGRIWTAYFDRGFGQPQTHYGPALFEADGRTVQPWWYCPDLDAYCLNVTDKSTWFCPYPGFLLTRIGHEGALSSWPLKGWRPTALACRQSQVALWCWQEFSLAEKLFQGEVTLLALTGRLPRVLGQRSVAASGPVLGRGPYFHCFGEGGWSRYDPFADLGR